MKPTLITSLLALGGLTAFGQGTLLFQNIGPTLDAPFINGYTGRGFIGENFKVELMVGRTVTSLTPAAMTSFSDRPQQAGYFLGGAVTLDGYPGGSKPFIEVRVWDSNTGTTYGQATHRGSTLFQLGAPLGDPGATPPTPPVELVGLTSIRVPLSPEPSTLVFTTVGAAALVFYQLRRRSRRSIENKTENRHL